MTCIGRDARVGGDLTCVGNVETTAASRSWPRWRGRHGTVATRTAYLAPAGPCDCDPSTFFDVDAAVSRQAGDQRRVQLEPRRQHSYLWWQLA
jgi:hypothetical protein